LREGRRSPIFGAFLISKTGALSPPPPASTQALHYPGYRLYLAGRFLSTIATMMQSVAIGWQVYALTHDPMALGLVGLAQFMPMLLLTLPGGDVADRHDRRMLMIASSAVMAGSASVLLICGLLQVKALWPFYTAVVIFGAARAFAGPASASLVPRLVPAVALANASALSSSSFQTAVIIGPALGGALYLIGPGLLYAVCCGLFLATCVTTLLLRVSGTVAPATPDPSALRRVAAGIRFVRHTPAVLGAISLDLFAVLLGGATALLPIYAGEILHAGPTGLGILRAAPALGAAVMGLFLARVPLERNAGPFMFGGVALYGIATIVFGLSQSMVLSFLALTIMGAADMVSVVVRITSIQLATPDEMRGRVNAVNQLFIGASNELGEFESGVTAALFGTVPAVIIGGIGTILVTLLWAGMFPELRKLDRMTDLAPPDEPAPKEQVP
jgi:MFS family permease